MCNCSWPSILYPLSCRCYWLHGPKDNGHLYPAQVAIPLGNTPWNGGFGDVRKGSDGTGNNKQVLHVPVPLGNKKTQMCLIYSYSSFNWEMNKGIINGPSWTSDTLPSVNCFISMWILTINLIVSYSLKALWKYLSYCFLLVSTVHLLLSHFLLISLLFCFKFLSPFVSIFQIC